MDVFSVPILEVDKRDDSIWHSRVDGGFFGFGRDIFLVVVKVS